MNDNIPQHLQAELEHQETPDFCAYIDVESNENKADNIFFTSSLLAFGRANKGHSG